MLTLNALRILVDRFAVGEISLTELWVLIDLVERGVAEPSDNLAGLDT